MALMAVPYQFQGLYNVIRKNEPLFLALQVIFLSGVSVLSSSYNLTWNRATEHWKNFHIRHCGRVCVNGSLKHTNPRVICIWPRSFERDCYQTCSFLDTCCPHGTIQLDGTFKRQRNQPSRETVFPPYSYPIQCSHIPYSSESYFQVRDCPPDGKEFTNSDSLNGEKDINVTEFCTRKYTDDINFEHILPYVDVKTGLLFRNRFCALCNGYSAKVIGSSPEPNDSNDSRVAVLWQLKVTCIHYQDVYSVTTMRQFVHTADETVTCSVDYDTPNAERKPRTCFSDPSQNYRPADTCEDYIKRLCIELNNTYLSLGGYKNIFCLMCEGFQDMHKQCPNAEDYFTSGLLARREKIIWFALLTLLLGISRMNKASVYRQWLNCTSDERWFDEYVSAN